MAEKQQFSEENSKSSDVKPKKVTTGAWWKSTVASTPQKVEQKTPPQKKRGRPKKSASPEPKQQITEKISGESKELDEKKQAEKKTARRGRPRRKSFEDQQNTTSVSTKVGSSNKRVSQTQVEESGEGSNSAEKESLPKKSARRGRPRKKPQPVKDRKLKQTEKVSTSSEKVEASVDDSATLTASNDQEIAEKKAKRSRKPRQKSRKSPRKKETAASSVEQVEEKIVSQIEQTIKSGDQDTFLETPQISPLEPTSISETEIIAEAEIEDQEPEETAELVVKVKEEVQQEQPIAETIEEERPKPVIKLLINAEEPEECRLALLEDGRLESIHVATSTRTQTKNNIYKARIVAIEPNLQAAFVDYGTEKNGFLPFSEIHPEYYKDNVSEKIQKLIDNHQWKKLSITDVVEKGREVLVQVVKEEVGKKGANMTTYLSLPGRCVVLMPGSDSTGISRKISGEERRAKLRDHILSLDIPEGIGWIVRTASVDITKAALGRDVNYLLRLWEDVKRKGQDLEGVGLIYQDHDHVLRFLREHFDPDIQEILVDDKDALEQVKSFIELLPAKQRSVKCKLHRGSRPIFNQYSIEDQIESIYQPKVNLPSGGSIVIDPTEALVAIDVNSGSTSKGQNFEETIFQANIEAAEELARQLRLRDLGGLIVVDFIDMRTKKNIREVERQVKAAMKRDKAKVDVSRISKFGLMQISRQKLGAPIEAGNYRVCINCKGRGVVRSVETLALYYLRRIHTAASRKMVYQIACRFPLDVAQYLLNNKRHELRELEIKYNTEVVITADPSYKPADNDIIYHKVEKDGASKKRS